MVNIHMMQMQIYHILMVNIIIISYYYQIYDYTHDAGIHKHNIHDDGEQQKMVTIFIICINY